MKRIALAGLCGMLVLSIGATSAEEHEVEMLTSGEEGSMVFEPTFLKVEKGDTVKFVPTDPSHNSVSESVPEGAEEWEGEINEEVTVELDTEGVYLYKCVPHLALGMVGVIQVGDSTDNLDEAKDAAENLKQDIAANESRLDEYLGQVEK